MSRLAVDTGGTFTDVVSVSESGQLRVHKLLSTPDDPGLALRDGVAVVSDGSIEGLVHGTTVATNALLERRGSKAGLITTRGFESLLVLGRQDRPSLYDLHVEPTPPLIPIEDTLGVLERLDHRGEVVRSLELAEVERAIAWIESRGFESVAICLLHAYSNGSHEQKLASAIRASIPRVHLSLSSEVMPEFREFERASTTSVNAFVGPLMQGYLQRLDRGLDVGQLDVFLSAGGRSGVDEAARLPVHTVLSGPAGGVVGALRAAPSLGIERVISFDMGGTSTDVSLANGEPTIARDSEIGGVPIGVPVIDIETVGAGGGSIGWCDRGGALRVGPRSAGANPGPACYGLGGTSPTVTDAHLVLGRLVPDAFLGGEMDLDPDASARAVATLAEEIDLTVHETAEGILQIADAAMVRAIKVVSLERGEDPSTCTLVSFGGAGGLHATRIAEALDIRTVLVPRHPGLLSAWGMLHAPRQFTSSFSVMAPVGRDDALERAIEVLEQRGARHIPDGSTRYAAAVRYVGQSFELELPVEPEFDADQLEERFHAAHERQFGYRADRTVECTAVRSITFGEAPRTFDERTRDGSRSSATMVTTTFGGAPTQTSVIERSQLGEGDEVRAPAIVTELSGTTVIPPGWGGRVASGHLLLERS